MSAGAYIEILYNSAILANNIASTALSFAALRGVRVNGATYGVNSSVIRVDGLFASGFAGGSI